MGFNGSYLNFADAISSETVISVGEKGADEGFGLRRDLDVRRKTAKKSQHDLLSRQFLSNYSH